MALERGHLRDVRQPLSELLPAETRGLDSTRRAIAVEDLLTMRAGLESTSFDQYGGFVSSRNWVQHALTRPVVASRGEGAPMIYSTGSTHLLSAVLTRATKQSTHAFARRSLAPLGIRLRPWTTDPARRVLRRQSNADDSPRDARVRTSVPGRRSRSRRNTVAGARVDRQLLGAAHHLQLERQRLRLRLVDPRGPRAYRILHLGLRGRFIFVVPVSVNGHRRDVGHSPARREGDHLDAVHGLVDELLAPAGASRF